MKRASKNMKLQTLLLAILMILAGSALAGTATLEFDTNELEFDAAVDQIEYEGFEATSAGLALTLPSRTYYVALGPGEEAEAINYQVTGSELLGYLSSEALEHDIPTGEIQVGGVNLASTFAENELGRKAVNVADVIQIDQDRYVSLVVFPVTVGADGAAQLNKTITIRMGPDILSPDRLLTKLPGVEFRSLESPLVTLSDGDAPIDYVIITAPELAMPMQRLAVYKNSTGYRSEVRFIGDVLALQTGRDDAEKLRNYLVQFYLDGGRLVLMAGDHTVLPIRYAYHRAVDTMPNLGVQQVCDLYFADLTGEWDQDNDNVWGERTHDQADLIPELWVGRLPFNRVEQFDAYVDKLIAYETEPGGDDRSYLSKTFFFSSDQMRDYSGGGQHARIALAYPDHFDIDTANGVELDRGDDPDPHNVVPSELEAVLSEGYGIVNIIAHGNGTLFEVRTSEYNKFPKTRFTTDTISSANGVISHLAPNGRTSFYYSLSCDNGAFDYDYPESMPNLVVTTLALPDAGAVAFVANSRWGWVGSSHLLQRAFFDSAFAHPDRPAVAAMYDSKLRYHYVRDVVYGQNFYGDPTLIVYDDVPGELSVEVQAESGAWDIDVSAAGEPVNNCLIVLCDTLGMVERVSTDDQGHVSISADYEPLNSYTVAAIKPGYTIELKAFAPSIAADADDPVDDNLPRDYGLSQNYPNPFNPHTTIRFDLPRRSQVDLSVYNVLGQHTATLSEGVLPFGTYEVTWDGRNQHGAAVASGVYFYRLIADGFTEEKKMVLVR